MSAPLVIPTRFREDTPAVLRAAVTADDATGDAHADGQGYFLKRADISTIHRSVFDVTNPSSPTTVENATSLTVSDVIVDTPVTTAPKWKTDARGYNFRNVAPATSFPTGGNRYRVEYKITLSGSVPLFVVFEGEADKVYTS